MVGLGVRNKPKRAFAITEIRISKPKHEIKLMRLVICLQPMVLVAY